MSKNEVRQQALRSRRALSKDEVASYSEMATRRLLRLPEYAKATVLATYVAKSDEVQTANIINHSLADGKTVLVPRSDPTSVELVFTKIHSLSDLTPGHFGVLEPPSTARPVPLGKADIVLVPIVAWDQNGHRLGYGKGYFDRVLRSDRGPLAVGLAFEAQRFEDIPQSPTDVRLDVIVTEGRVLHFVRHPN